MIRQLLVFVPRGGDRMMMRSSVEPIVTRSEHLRTSWTALDAPGWLLCEVEVPGELVDVDRLIADLQATGARTELLP